MRQSGYEGRVAGVTPSLAEGARSECAPSMRAVGDRPCYPPAEEGMSKLGGSIYIVRRAQWMFGGQAVTCNVTH